MAVQQEVSATQSLPAWAYKAILEQLDEAVIIMTMDGSFRRMNPAAAKLYGYDEPDEYERHLPKLSSIFELRSYPDRKRIAFREWPSSRLRRGAQHVDLQAYLKRLDTKHEVLLHYTGKQVKNPDGTAAFVLLSIRDIGGSKQAEAELDELLARTQAELSEIRAGRQQLENLFNQAPALVAILKGREGVCELFNPLFRQLWGNRDVIGKPMRQAWPELEGQGYFEMVEKVYDTGEAVYQTEYPATADWNSDGKLTEAFFNFVYAPYREADGTTAGVMIFGYEATEQVRIRQTLQQERERLELAQKAGNIGTFEWKIPENKNIWSEQLENLYGLPAGSFGGTLQHWRQAVDPTDLQRVEKLIERAFRSRERHFETEWRVRLPDKTIRNIYAKAEIFYDTDGKPLRMLGINMDITERRKAATAFKASVDRQSAFFKTALDAIVTVDHTGVITEFNPAAERIFGYSRDEVVGQEMARLIIPPKYRQAHRQGMAEYMKTGRGAVIDRQIEITALRKDGQEFPVELFITRIGSEDPPVFMGTLRDITERKRSEQALRESEQRFRFMAESMPQKIFTTMPDGTTDYVNPQWLEYTGMTFEQIRDSGWAGFVHPDDLKENQRIWERSLQTGRPFQFEHRFRRADGSYHWHLSRAHAMRDERGAIIKWIGSNTDIEDIKRRQELEEKTTLLTEQREQLMGLNRAKDEFISLASHQLRTPATGVKQYVGMLMQGYFGALSDDQMAMVRSAYESNERQLGIINALLNVARLDAGKVKLTPVPCDISQMLGDIVQEQAEVFRMRRQKLTLQMPRSPVVCDADGQLIRMVLENIIDNAGKYSPEGRDVEVRLRQTKAHTVIEVQDHGVGMRKADQSKLFQKFSRIDNELSTSASGSGLGLYWAKKIMDLHQGAITVESKARHGSTFTITIPAVRRP